MPRGSTREAEQAQPRQRRMSAGSRREQLLDVAQHAFSRSGYHGTTTLEIGRQAGVSEKLVLKHFGNKEALFRASVADPLLGLLTSANAEARARLGAPSMESPDDSYVRVHQFLSTWASLIRERGPMLLTFVADRRDFPDVSGKLIELFARQVDEATEILTIAGRDPGCRPFDARVALLAALGAATVAAVASDDAEAFLDEYLRITLFGILSDEGRAAVQPSAPDEQGGGRGAGARGRQ